MINRDEKWDLRWMGMALHVSSWSKDPRTKVGAMIVRDRRDLSSGYNGFPQRTNDGPEMYDNRIKKLQRVVHAEANAIATAAQFGHWLGGGTLYSTFPICCHCAGLVIQAGIIRVVTPEEPDGYDPIYHEYLGWSESLEMFAEARVIVDTVL